MRGVRRAERLYHMAVKQVAKERSDRELHEEWVDYLYWACNLIGAMRTRLWDWDDEEGC